VYDQETGLYYLQSRYYDPEMGRFINADVFTSTGQGFTGNNMFAYCGNNPVNRADKSGCGWTIVLGVAVGAGIGVLTSWIGSLVTNQEFTWVDACIAAVSGGVSYFGPWGLVAGGAINGIYSGITAYNNGASWYGATGIGISSFLFNMLSFGELANAGNDLTGIATSGFIDLIFGTGFSSMDAAISKTVADKTHRSTSSKKPTSALAVITETGDKGTVLLSPFS